MAAVAAADIYVYEPDTGLTQEPHNPSPMKEIIVETANTADNGDTVAVDVSAYGMSKVAYVKGFKHTTSNSVIAGETPTTAVSGTVLTITIGGATANLKRIFIVGGY